MEIKNLSGNLKKLYSESEKFRNIVDNQTLYKNEIGDNILHDAARSIDFQEEHREEDRVYFRNLELNMLISVDFISRNAYGFSVKLEFEIPAGLTNGDMESSVWDTFSFELHNLPEQYFNYGYGRLVAIQLLELFEESF